jgi:transcriptional regulator with XRE-family HTH domain
MKLKTYTGEEIRELRRKLGMNQSEFWKIFMTTQSGGSRYESGREIPAPTQMLLNLAFGTDKKHGEIVSKLRPVGKPPKKHRSTVAER